MQRKRKTSMISFRVENQLKSKLEAVALKEGRTLSSCIVRILQDSLDPQHDAKPLRGIQEERRHHPRKQILLPARWRIRQEDYVVDHDVLLRNLSVGGAYTEYINGKGFQLFQDLQDSLLALIVRIPGSEEPVVLDCKVSRIHITSDRTGVGLRFLDSLRNENLMELKGASGF